MAFRFAPNPLRNNFPSFPFTAINMRPILLQGHVRSSPSAPPRRRLLTCPSRLDP
jgi:hypothetical protein